MNVAVIGSGVTGLTAAWLLRRHGIPVTVFEATSREGGLGATFESHGFSFDFGPHEFTTKNDALIALLQEVCGDDLIVIEKHIAQHFNGRFVRYPFEVVDVLRNVSPRICARAFGEVAWSRLRNRFRSPVDASFASWTSARFGPTLYETYFGPYTQKVWGVEPNTLDPRTASQRITTDSLWDLVKKTLGYQLFGAEDYKRTHSEYRRRFHYVRRGIGTLQSHLRRGAEGAGCVFETGKRLSAVDIGTAGIECLHFADGTAASGFSYILSTIPLPAMVEMSLGQRGRDLVRQNDLPFRGMVFVFLRLAIPRLAPYHWIYFPDRDVLFQRSTEFTLFDPAMAPPGCTGVTLEVASNPGDGTWERADDDIAAQCVAQLNALGLCPEHAVLGWDVVRVTHAYPIQVMGFLEKADALLGALERVPNLLSIGRQGMFRYCNMNECMEMAMEVVPEIVRGAKSIRCRTTNGWEGVALTDRHSPNGTSKRPSSA